MTSIIGVVSAFLAGEPCLAGYSREARTDCTDSFSLCLRTLLSYLEAKGTQMRASKVFRPILGVVVAMLLGACIQPGTERPQRPLNWDTVIEDGNLAGSVYSIGLMIDGLGYLAVGTGFAAHYPTTLWTNAHVALVLEGILAESQDILEFFEVDPAASVTPVAVRAGTPVGGAHTYRLNMAPGGYTIHPEYNEITEPEPDEEFVQTPDLAVFHVPKASFSDVPSFLPRALATELRAGQPIGTLGFPGELSYFLEKVPIATFKEGTISALRPYSVQEPEVTPANSKVVQFNLGQTGGTSGSPVFDHEGFIVAVSFAGIVILVGDEEKGYVPIPVGDLDFGVRVDEVWTLIDLIETGAEPAVSSRVYPHSTYRAYPEGWNGQ